MTESTILELLKADRQRFRSNAFWVRFYRDGEDGARVKVTEKLCDKTKEFHAVDCHAVTVFRDIHMAQVNRITTSKSLPCPASPRTPTTFGAFWLTTYLPWIEANKRFSTIRGYKYAWSLYLNDELETKPLSTYSTLECIRTTEKENDSLFSTI